MTTFGGEFLGLLQPIVDSWRPVYAVIQEGRSNRSHFGILAAVAQAQAMRADELMGRLAMGAWPDEMSAIRARGLEAELEKIPAVIDEIAGAMAALMAARRAELREAETRVARALLAVRSVYLQLGGVTDAFDRPR